MKPEPHVFQGEYAADTTISLSLSLARSKSIPVSKLGRPRQWLVNIIAAVLFR